MVGGLGATGSDSVLIRASGPALAPLGVTGFLPDPNLGLNNASGPIGFNSGWAGSAEVSAAAASAGAFAWTSPTSHDAALVESLPAGSYTAQVTGASGDAGIALAEVYDTTASGSFTSTGSHLVNLSARAQVGTGANVLIAGFVIGGTTSKTVLIRASGPALAAFNLTGVLPDPTLQLYQSGSGGASTLVAANTGWNGDTGIAGAAASVGAFSWGTAATADSAILVTLAPGAYTAEVSGAAGDTGMALVEIYDVP